MAGLDVNLGTSVLKREAKDIDEVEKILQRDGWEKTGQVANGRFRYYEYSNINITAIGGPLGTVIMPSGPVRGFIFGEFDMFSRRTAIDELDKSEQKEEVSPEPAKGSNNDSSSML